LHPGRHIHVCLAGGCLQLGVIASPDFLDAAALRFM
jgi:hypothetical protein